PRTDGFALSQTVGTRQDHYQGLFDERTERQLWHTFFPPKKSCIDGSLQNGISELRRVLTRYHHVDVRQRVAQDLQGFGHPRQFVSGQKAHREAWLGGMSDPARSFGCRLNLRQCHAGVLEKGSTRRCQIDAASGTRQELGTYLVFKIPNLPAQRRL